VTATILVADDDDDTREIVADALESMGYTAIAAPNGDRALDVLRETPTVRLLIADVRMPGMSGLDLATHAQRLYPDLRVIFISGYFRPANVLGRFLKKPFNVAELAAAVKAELG
jgi:two-component system, cell cycle sensor histidine kinase and response regulator CckA